MKNRETLLIGFLIGVLSFLLLQYILLHVFDLPVRETYPPGNVSKDWTDVGGNIDIEYYLEVSEDSIWVEGVQSKKVYSGTYSQLDSLITLDNQ
jgi:hypothetical protein